MSSEHFLDQQQSPAESGWVVVVGVVYLAAGILALGTAFATAASVFIVGMMMMIAGTTEVINSLSVELVAKRLILMFIGVLYILGGVAAMVNPVFTATLLTLLLGAALVGSGIARVVITLLERKTSWAGVMLTGLASAVLGTVILIRWPVSSVRILGVLLSLDLMITGIGWLTIGYGLSTRRPSGLLPRIMRSASRFTR
jgi:uncharacterized membrane protein HdeD (DUF308 family)